MSVVSIGLDFGTTNSVASALEKDSEQRTITYSRPEGPESIFPSLLTFWEDDTTAGRLVNCVEAGQWAVDAFELHAPDCRFIRSIKTFAANPHFESTKIYTSRYEFSDLMYAFLKSMRQHGENRAAWDQPAIVVGRPIRFAGPTPDEDLAMRRYRRALGKLGFRRISFVYEPLAAAYFFVRQLRGEATIFVGDLGGGTSDFSILKVKHVDGTMVPTPLASHGIGLAGDQFDYRIIQNVVAPALGKGSKYRSFDKELDIPASYFSKLAHWNEFSMLRGSKFYRELQSLLKRALEPKRIQRFLHFIEAEMMHELSVRVALTKRQLSESDSARFALEFEGAVIAHDILRREFEGWIEDDLKRLDALVDETLKKAGLSAGDIDIVFLTGGTSFVPAVQELFRSRFGRAAFESRDQLISVANGLALIARERAAAWFVNTESSV